jgi:1-deoxy-D-xylulose-5-phosphate synthase
MREELREAVEWSQGPTALRYAKSAIGPDIPAVRRTGEVDVLREPADPAVLLVAVGATAELVLDVAGRVGAQGIAATVVDPRWVLPVAPELVEIAAGHQLVVTIEDSGRVGGIGSQLSQALRDADVDVATREVGIPRQFLPQNKVGTIQAEIGMTAQDIARRVVEWAARIEGKKTSEQQAIGAELAERPSDTAPQGQPDDTRSEDNAEQ